MSGWVLSVGSHKVKDFSHFKIISTCHDLVIRNKTGLQPVSRPVEPILGFFQKVLKRCKKLCKNYKELL